MRKHLSKMILLAVLCLLLTGCGQTAQSGGTLPESSAEQREQAQPSAGEPDAAEELDAAGEPEAPADSKTYTDNFSVDQADAEAFAQKIQSVVADKDLEGLADLMTFPNYVGLPEQAEFVDTREDFLALGADRVFTEELLSEISTADVSALEPSQAGFIVSASGCPNIIFGVADGQLAIVGINY